MQTFFEIAVSGGLTVLRLRSDDGINRVTRDCVAALTRAIAGWAREAKPLVITGNRRFYSAGEDLAEIAALNGPAAREFSRMGQSLMNAIEHFPAPVYAAPAPVYAAPPAPPVNGAPAYAAPAPAAPPAYGAPAPAAPPTPVSAPAPLPAPYPVRGN